MNPERNEVVVSMKEIPGYMDAMVMTLPIPAGSGTPGSAPGNDDRLHVSSDRESILC